MANESLKTFLGTIPVPEKSRESVLKTPLDSQNTTLGSVQRLLIQDKFTPNLDLSGLHQGVIMKVIEKPRLFEYSPKNELETFNQNKATGTQIKAPIRYKVYVQGPAGACYPMPDNESSVAIDFLDDYSAAPGLFAQLTLRSIVFVDIVDKVINGVNDPTMYNQPSGSNTNPSAAYNGSSKEPTTVGDKSAAGAPTEPTKIIPAGPLITVDNIPDDVIEEEAWANGKSIGKIKLKKVVSYTSQMMREDAAAAFNEMCKAAKNDKILLYGSSGFRQQQKQIELYNERYEKPYPTKPRDNTLSAKGQRSGVAAYPGTSNHQSGIAIDIDVGPSKKEPDRYAGDMGRDPRYIWLRDNAATFGFSNAEGRRVNEPWHWVYTK